MTTDFHQVTAQIESRLDADSANLRQHGITRYAVWYAEEPTPAIVTVYEVRWIDAPANHLVGHRREVAALDPEELAMLTDDVILFDIEEPPGSYLAVAEVDAFGIQWVETPPQPLLEAPQLRRVR